MTDCDGRRHAFRVHSGKAARNWLPTRSLAPAREDLGGRRIGSCRETVRVAAPAQDPEVEGFLALLATRRAPKTVEAYRRDLAALGAWLDRPLGRITTEQLEQYIAELRAAGLSPATISRRIAATRV